MVSETQPFQATTSRVTTRKPRARKPVTPDQFLMMDVGNRRAELIDGKVIYMAPAGGEHGFYALEIGAEIRNYVKKHKLGIGCAAETGFRLFPDRNTVRAPDAAFISSQTLERHRDQMDGQTRTAKFWPFAPDLAVEVVSPGDKVEDVEAKVADWFAGGTQLVWVVHPKSRTIHVFRSATQVQILSADDELDGEDVVPGFRCPISDIFD